LLGFTTRRLGERRVGEVDHEEGESNYLLHMGTPYTTSNLLSFRAKIDVSKPC